jgi:hypothetical protein
MPWFREKESEVPPPLHLELLWRGRMGKREV